MREIKFRAWDTVRNKWFMEWENPARATFTDDGKKEYSIISSDGTIIHEQFIGLCDKNKNEIYEGDIVKWHTNGHDIIAPVYFEEQQASFWMGHNSKMSLVLNDWMYGEYEVIGNIHENQELLA